MRVERQQLQGWLRLGAAFVLGLVVGVVLTTFRPAYRVPSEQLLAFADHSGVNLPWLRYGWDLGAHPWGGAPGGFHANRERLDADLAFARRHGVSLLRVFLFSDFRTGLVWDADGAVTGLDAHVGDDMQTLLDAAVRHDLRLIPVLMDHTLADGIAEEDGLPVGEHPGFMTDPVQRDRFLSVALAPFLERFGRHTAVFAWEVMNEPRLATAVEPDAIRAFVEAVAALITRSAPGVPVTVGHYDRYHLDEYGAAVSDVLQVHYYYHMRAYWLFDTPARRISEKPVLIGELEPVAVQRQLELAVGNGYKGVLFWSLNAADGYDFRSQAEAYAAWVRAARR